MPYEGLTLFKSDEQEVGGILPEVGAKPLLILLLF